MPPKEMPEGEIYIDGQPVTEVTEIPSLPEMFTTSEQWTDKGAGRCEVCRRRKYCSKPCTINKIAREEILRLQVAEAAAKHLL